MGYITRNLLEDEEIEYSTKLHWVVFISPLFIFFVSCAFILIASDVQAQNLKSFFTIAGPVLLFFSIVTGLSTVIAYFTSEFGVTNQRVLIKVGLIRRDTFELLLNKVESFQVNQSILGRILDYGTIIILGTGGGKNTFHNIDDPLELKNQVQQSAKEYEQRFSTNHPPASDKNKKIVSVADELQKLSDLVKQGILTEDEFEEQKRKLL
jgi:uncharacterized membrane protein YdbT with pleckstrin-like domain